jgi:hypothetical protein
VGIQSTTTYKASNIQVQRASGLLLITVFRLFIEAPSTQITGGFSLFQVWLSLQALSSSSASSSASSWMAGLICTIGGGKKVNEENQNK